MDPTCIDVTGEGGLLALGVVLGVRVLIGTFDALRDRFKWARTAGDAMGYALGGKPERFAPKPQPAPLSSIPPTRSQTDSQDGSR